MRLSGLWEIPTARTRNAQVSGSSPLAGSMISTRRRFEGHVSLAPRAGPTEMPTEHWSNEATTVCVCGKLREVSRLCAGTRTALRLLPGMLRARADWITPYRRPLRDSP